MKRTLQQRAFNLRVTAMKKGLTNRAIAKALGCSEDLVSKAFMLQRMEAFRRVAKYVRSYRPSRQAA
jgi:DNA-binding NarL/FixJ family response regulator